MASSGHGGTVRVTRGKGGRQKEREGGRESGEEGEIAVFALSLFLNMPGHMIVCWRVP
jgi:hypothetical protein